MLRHCHFSYFNYKLNFFWGIYFSCLNRLLFLGQFPLYVKHLIILIMCLHFVIWKQFLKVMRFIVFESEHLCTCACACVSVEIGCVCAKGRKDPFMGANLLTYISLTLCILKGRLAQSKAVSVWETSACGSADFRPRLQDSHAPLFKSSGWGEEIAGLIATEKRAPRANLGSQGPAALSQCPCSV